MNSKRGKGQQGMTEHKKEMMTYEQWKAVYKKHIKNLIRRKAINCLYWLVTIAIFIGLPFGMFFHWLIIGY